MIAKKRGMELHRLVLPFFVFVISTKAHNWQPLPRTLTPTTEVRSPASPVFRREPSRTKILAMSVKTDGKRLVRQDGLPEFEENNGLGNVAQTVPIVVSSELAKSNQIDELPAFEENRSEGANPTGVLEPRPNDISSSLGIDPVRADGLNELIENEIETNSGSKNSNKNDEGDTNSPVADLIVTSDDEPPVSEIPISTISPADSAQTTNEGEQSSVEDEDTEAAEELIKFLTETSGELAALTKDGESTSKSLNETKRALDFVQRDTTNIENQISELEGRTSTLEIQVARLPRLETIRATVQQMLQQAIAQTSKYTYGPTPQPTYYVQQHLPAYRSFSTVPVVVRNNRSLKVYESAKINETLTDAVFRSRCLSVQVSDNLLVCAKSNVNQNKTEVGATDIEMIVKDLCKKL